MTEHPESLEALRKALAEAEARVAALLREGAKERALVLETTTDGFWVVDLRGRLVDANPAAAAMLGRSVEELLSLSISDIDVLETPERTRRHIAEVQARGADRFESRHRRRDGSVFDVEVSVSLLPTPEAQIVVFVRDISARKRAERIQDAQLRLIALAARASVAELLQATLDEAEALTGSTIGFFHFVEADQETLSLQAWSTATRQRYCQAEGDGLHYAVSQAGVWADALRERRPMLHNDYESLPHRRGLPPGHARLLRELVVPVRRGDKVVALVGVGNKSTPYDDLDAATVQQLAELLWETVVRRQVELALVEKEALLRRSEAIAHVGSWQLDHASGRLRWSDEVYRIFGRSRDSSEPTFEALLDCVHPEDRTAVDAAFVSSLEAHSDTCELVHRIVHPEGGAPRHVHCKWEHQRDGSGRIVRSVGMVQDITERESQRRERAQMETRLRHAAKMEAVGRLAGGIAHDFNNVLGAVLANLELALEEVPAQSLLRELLEETAAAADRAAVLTQQLLAFSRKQVLEPKVIDLNALVSRLHPMIERWLGEHIALRLQLARPLGRVRADPGQIQQLVLNLAANARDAMPTGGELRIATGDAILGAEALADLPRLAPGAYVTLEVSDTGSGIPEEARERIFEPFYTTKALGQGTGLGLATALGVVEQHGGGITCHSTLGEGTTFRVYFPRVEAELDTPPEPPIAPRPRGGETVLLVEDDELLRRAFSRHLERGGYRVLTASSGAEALQLASEATETIHLLLSDVVLPGMTGPEVATRLLELRSDLRVIFTSGYPADTISRHGVLEEGIELLHKPVDPEALLQRIRQVLDRSGGSSR